MTEERTVLAYETKRSPKLYLICCGEVTEWALCGLQAFGRESKNVKPEIAVSYSFVSRKHGEFITNEYGTYYRDLGSMNGTYYGDACLKPNAGVPLQNGDILRVNANGEEKSPEDILMIYVTDYPECIWQRIDLSAVRAVDIGRTANLKLESNMVSHNHASFFLAKNGWAVIDHDSRNGVFRNARRIGEPEYLETNDVIRIANYHFIYGGSFLLFQMDVPRRAEVYEPVQQTPVQPTPVQPVQPTPMQQPAPVQPTPMQQPAEERRPVREAGDTPGLSIDIIERSVWGRVRKKLLLKDIRMDIPIGSMVLILGGSGAGKTTFMNAVMGYEQAEGTVKYKNTDIYEEFERMQYEIGYVPQSDLMRPNDVVFETVLNAAQLKLETGKGQRYYEDAASRALDVLGLADEKDQLVRALSGGQRKRLSIAMEYVGNPSLFFLDEPDSGVDNTNSELLLKNLRMIADEGKIVMFISHSPDRTIKLIDKIIVLAKDSENDCGRLVFFGNPYKALAFFDVPDLNKIVTRINKKNEGGDGLADEYIAKFEREGHLYG